MFSAHNQNMTETCTYLVVKLTSCIYTLVSVILSL